MGLGHWLSKAADYTPIVSNIKGGIQGNYTQAVGGPFYTGANDASQAVGGGDIGDPLKSTSVGQKIDSITHPERAYDKLAAGLNDTASKAQALADLQWQRQMQGLSQALGYVNHSQGAYDRVYNSPMPVPGATLPNGLGGPRMGTMSAPGPAQPGMMPVANQTAPGLAGYFGRNR